MNRLLANGRCALPYRHAAKPECGGREKEKRRDDPRLPSFNPDHPDHQRSH